MPYVLPQLLALGYISPPGESGLPFRQDQKPVPNNQWGRMLCWGL